MRDVSAWWIVPALEFVLLVILIAVDPGRVDDLSKRERRVTLTLITIMTVGTVASLSLLMYDILHGSSLTANNLLGRGGAIWLANVIAFSLWFWELDRGSPAGRAAGTGVPLSFAFPENAMPEFAAEGWIPKYPDYLYLAFTNATAFSPTDVMPLTLRAKYAMLVQSSVALALFGLIVARAVNAFT